MAVRLCNSGGILVCGVMAERRVAELLMIEAEWLSFAKGKTGLVLAGGFGDVVAMQNRLDKACLFCRGMLRSPAMTPAERGDMIEEMRTFVAAEDKLRGRR